MLTDIIFRTLVRVNMKTQNSKHLFWGCHRLAGTGQRVKTSEQGNSFKGLVYIEMH